MKIRDFRFALIPSAFLAGMLLAGAAIAQQDLDETEAAASEPETAMEESARPECVRVTGSRICRDPESIEQFGRTLNTPFNVSVYSRDEMYTTGHATAADALRQLDPRFW